MGRLAGSLVSGRPEHVEPLRAASVILLRGNPFEIGQTVTAIQGRRRVDRLLACRSLDEQRAVVDRDWDTRRWRAMLDLALADRLLARVVDASDAGARIRAEIDHVLRDVDRGQLLRALHAAADVCG